MIPGVNQKQLEQAMKKLGVKQQKIEAYEVVIRTKDRNLVIRDPDIIQVNMMGSESLQITGKIEEELNITEDDVNTVAEQGGVTKEEARGALENNGGDLAKAILELKSRKG